MRVLIVGRFQPFHMGHLKLLRQAAKKGDVIIALGSANESGTPTNPMTAEERTQCIRKVLEQENIDAKIVPIIDFHDDEKWTNYLVSKVPEFELVISGNPLVRRLLRERGYAVETPDYLEDRWKYKGTYVRDCIARGEDISGMVPPVVKKFLEKNNIDKRICSGK